MSVRYGFMLKRKLLRVRYGHLIILHLYYVVRIFEYKPLRSSILPAFPPYSSGRMSCGMWLYRKRWSCVVVTVYNSIGTLQTSD